jgi:hypothetical protein
MMFRREIATAGRWNRDRDEIAWNPLSLLS